MNRDEMVAKLAQHGYDVSKLTDTVPDEAIAETLRAIEASKQTAQPETPAPMPSADGAQANEEGDEMPTEQVQEEIEVSPEQIDELIAQLQAMKNGGQPSEEHSEEEEEAARRAEEESAAQEEEEAAAHAEYQSFCEEVNAANQAYAKMSEGPEKAQIKVVLDRLNKSISEQPSKEEVEMATIDQVLHKFAEEVEGGFAAIVEHVNAQNANLKKEILDAIKKTDDKATGVAQGAVKMAEDLEAEKKHGFVSTFCENMVKEGKIASYEMDESNPAVPSIKQQLLDADSRTPIRKFKEQSGKEVVMTQLDSMMSAIRARPVQKFSEKVLAHGKSSSANGATGLESEKAVIHEHFEKFSEAYASADQTEEKLQNGFAAERKLNPKLTAAEFLGFAQVA